MSELLLLSSGCTSPLIQDEFAVYETVLRKQLEHEKKDAPLYLFVDGKDPLPDLLVRLQKNWPNMRDGSKVSGNRELRISLKELQWIDSFTAELLVGTSNGIDGSIARYRVVYKNGVWEIEKTKIEAIS